ncbi:inositol monophosphatase family protein [Rhizomicrobium electricum]|jgi:myo-inositol-1(or 4)-monophosphatase|uniref:Inositol-1-monophosphatase n=1 Tax=Rhizomicrobium electricum TaxID=480070 RepID=A0ABP3PV64_9PROT|nr:inositol monophosphatase family protein [Rhizomicrobium electricum]NIJ49983.1 myo-inositol-1(or 4)-monophosphatase [Rhizomicrobium electricum]
MPYLSPALNVMVAAARKAARPLIRDFGELENLQVSHKGPADFVSNADERTERILYEELTKARPGYGFLGEEGGFREGPDKTHRFIIDPIDGTTNFLHGVPIFAISIALEREGQLQSAVIYNPISDELYVAEKGHGAYLNDKRLRVAARKSLPETLMATGIPYMARGTDEERERSLAEVKAIVSRTSGIRRCGAASLDLAFTAAGRFDAFWERGLNPWDIAAGILLVREAGGLVTNLNGSSDPFSNGDVLATNETLHPQLMAILQNPFS